MVKKNRSKFGAMGWSLLLLKDACKLLQRAIDNRVTDSWHDDAEELLAEVEDSMLVSVK